MRVLEIRPEGRILGYSALWLGGGALKELLIWSEDEWEQIGPVVEAKCAPSERIAACNNSVKISPHGSGIAA